MATDYLFEVLDPNKIAKNVNKMVRAIKLRCPHVQAIALRGMSGGLIAPLVAAKMKLPLILVRKESSHSNHTVETLLDRTHQRFSPLSYVICDDLVSSGTTVYTIHEGVTSLFPAAELGGVFLFADGFLNEIKRFYADDGKCLDFDCWSIHDRKTFKRKVQL